MSVKIEENWKNVATVKKSILLILCRFEGLGKQVKDIRLVFWNIPFNGRKPRKTVTLSEARISPRENSKFYTFQLLAAQTFT